MSKTIGLLCAVFIICTQATTSWAGYSQVVQCFEPEKCEEKASISNKVVTREIQLIDKASLSMKLMNNAKNNHPRFNIQEDQRMIKASSQTKPSLSVSTVSLFLLVLLAKSRLVLRMASLNILIMLYMSMSEVTAQPFPACPHNYYSSSGNCQFFSNMQGCAGANGNVCVSCNSNYYLSGSFMCVLCSSSILNCQTCSSSLACSQCISGYAVNSISHVCDSCSLIIPKCSTCYSKFVCMTCVDQTYFVNQSSKCQLCIKRKLGCLRCDPNTCYQCVPGYALINATCFQCKIVGCATCNDPDYCTKCINTAYILSVDTCIPCGNVFPFCQNCTSTVCTACEPSFFLNTSSKCHCMRGQQIDGECIDIAGCNAAIKYNNQSYCTQCDQSIFKFNTSTLKCDCLKGFLVNYRCSVLYGCITMILVNNMQTCIACNFSGYFIANNGECSCKKGFYFDENNHSCNQTCGDGLLFYLECDDGNLIDGDGCNSQCEIEDNFICIRSNSTTATLCINRMQNFELKVQEIENVGAYNIAKFQFLIVNFIQFLHTLNWTKLFYLEIGKQHNVTSISITGNKVTFIVEYFEDLEGFPAVFHLNLSPEYFLYPKVVSLPFLMVSETAPLVLNEYPSEFILDILSKVLFALSILSILLLLFAPCVHKMIALETITVLQLCNLAPFLIPGDSLTIRVFSSLSLSNGFGRQLFTDPNTSETFGTAFEHMSLAKTFTQNMLINETFLLTVVLIFIILYFLKEKMDNKKTRDSIQHFAYVYFWNLVFSVAMALLLVSLIALNCNNHRVYERTYSGITYESTKKYQIVSSTVNLLSVFMVLPLIAAVGFINVFAFSAQANVLRQSRSKVIRIIYKQIERLNVKNKIYVSMFVANIFVSFASLSGFFFIDFECKVFIYFLASLPFALIVMVYRPYNKSIDNFGVCLGQFTSLIFVSGLCAKQYFRIIKVSLMLRYELYFCIGIVFLLTIFVITSITRFFTSWLWYLDLIKQNKVERQNKLNARKLSQERVVMQFEGQKKKDYFNNRPKFQEITTDEDPDLQRIKQKLRDNLFEKRNLQKTIKTLSDPFDPFGQALM